MSDSTPIQINFKTKKDGMLINLRANDGAELDLLMTQVSERLAALVDLEKTVEGMAVVKNAFPNAQVISSTSLPNRSRAASIASSISLSVGAESNSHIIWSAGLSIWAAHSLSCSIIGSTSACVLLVNIASKRRLIVWECVSADM